MKKNITIQISLDEKASFETVEGKQDITSEVFDSLLEAVEEAIKENVNFDNEDFCNSILQNHSQKLPENFKSFKGIGLKVQIN